MSQPPSGSSPRGSKRPAPSLKARALQWLSQREYTRQELTKKLQPHCADHDNLPLLLDELARKGWLSDDRAAASLVHRRAGKLGVARIRQELKQKGVAADAKRYETFLKANWKSDGKSPAELKREAEKVFAAQMP